MHESYDDPPVAREAAGGLPSELMRVPDFPHPTRHWRLLASASGRTVVVGLRAALRSRREFVLQQVPVNLFTRV